MNKDAALLPLETVEKYTKLYPGIWDTCEFMHSMENGNWDKARCYLPVGAALAIQMHYKLPMETVYMLPALSAWRQWKEVYTFDETLEEVLYEQKSDTIMPSAVIMAIPFPCIYISANKYKFFAHLEYDTNDGRWELRFARLMDDRTTRAYFLHIGEMTIEQSLQAVVKESDRVLTEVIPNSPDLQNNIMENPIEVGYADSLNALAIREMLQLYLYCCSSNADLQQPEENKRTYKPRGRGKIKDKYREVRKWDAGYYIGSKIRKISAPHSETKPGVGHPKRPHIRRGHWHHFWVGSGKDKHLKLQWVFPIMINGDEGDAPARIITEK